MILIPRKSKWGQLPLLNRSASLIKSAGSIVVILCLFLRQNVASANQQNSAQSYVPPKGVVPDAESATKIAELILVPIYGLKTVARQQPLVATLKDGIWIVTGTLTRGTPGGVAHVEISKRDCRVLSISHGK